MEPRARDVIERCLRGDDVAKADFIITYGDLLRRAIAHKLASMSTHAPVRQDVEDIANDFMVRLLENNCALLAQIRDRDRIQAWITVAARNFTIDYVRKWNSRMLLQGLVVRETPPAYAAPAARAAEDAEASAELRARIDALPANERLVLELYYTHSMSYADIAGLTGLNINTVATHIRRAREHLRARYQLEEAHDARHA